MNKVASFLKKTLKITLWIIISFMLLFFTLAILIQVPAIQKKIIDYATSFVSNKTHTRVDIRKISLSFPNGVMVEGVYLEDQKKDTLLFAGMIKANLSLKDLLNKEIHLSSVSLEQVNLGIDRSSGDSLFNYNFLLTAFSDTTKKEAPKKGSKWAIAADDLDLKDIRLKYADNYGGTNLSAKLKYLKLTMNEIDLEKSIFSIDELLVDHLTAGIILNKSEITKTKSAGGSLPTFKANKIQISNISFKYGDSITEQSLTAGISLLKLKDAFTDLQNEVINLDSITLSNSKIRFNRNDSLSSNSKAVVEASQKSQNNWKISVQNINLDNNSMAYMITNKSTKDNTFDADHMDYSHLSLEAKDLFYSADLTKVNVKKFQTTDQNGFSITKFETEFIMDQHSITAQKLKLKTKNSSITADLKIKYSSLASLKDSIPYMVVSADMKNMKVKNSDILYFAPTLSKQTFFQDTNNITTISGNITGPVNNLKGKSIAITTGQNTIVNTDFIVAGLPETKTAYFNFPNLKVNSGKRDIVMMVGSLIPKTMDLPENISMQIVFKGLLKAFESTIGMSSSFGSARMFATIDKNENFNSKVSTTAFDLGKLLKNKELFGPVTLTAETSGHGLDKHTVQAKIKADASEIYLNKYNYHNLSVDGNIKGQQFEGIIDLDDKNAVLNFKGLVNLKEEQYKFLLNVEGADLKKLHLTEDNIQIGLIAVSDLKGGTANEINGKAGITKIIVTHEGKKYVLDSVLVASINEKNKSELSINSALVGIKYNGTFSPADLPKELNRFINNYFSFSDKDKSEKKNERQNFNFEIQLHNHPILSEVFLPQLKEFEPGIITGNFDSQKSELKLTADMRKVVYGSTEVNNLLIDINSDSSALNYKLSCSNISNSDIKLDNFLVDGKLADNSLYVNASSIDENENKKLLVRSQIIKNGDNYKLTLDPKEFYLMNNRWDIASDNYIEFGKPGFLIHHLFINKAESQINIASVNNRFNDDLNIAINNFQLNDISGIIEKDTSLIKGKVDGNILLKRVNNTYGLIADAKISDLYVREVPVGNLDINAVNPTAERFDVKMSLSGKENDLTANGYYIPKGGDNSINMTLDMRSLSLKTVEAFSMGSITNASGNSKGNFLITGNAASPDITGDLVFQNVLLTPTALNNPLEFKNETIQLRKDGIYFNSFTILDLDKHPAVINGNIKMQHFKDLVFSLDVNTKNFLLFNTTAKDNEEFYGRMVIDSKIELNGPMLLPVVNAKLKMKKGSNFTFAVPEKKLNTDKGEDVVEFDDSLQLNPILARGTKKQKQESKLTGFDISSVIEIDKQATLRLLMDPYSTDSLVVRGEAALSFSIDRSGKMSLTGAYNLNDGSYLVSLESVMKRKFEIDPGSTIIWNGDPMDAEIVINATYSVRASPIDLVADQMSGLTEAEQSGYKQRYPFLVLLKLRGAISHPELSFEIQLRPEDRGILGGAVNAKLNMLNEDPSALNKQVFALLVLSRFVQENPLQTETNAASAAARTTVGKFLSAQLNQLSSKVVPGVELNFDVQSYDEYNSGQEEGRTEVDISVKKQLFNERLSVQVGGSVDVEGEKAKQNSASDITSDVTLEYKLTKDGRYRLKGFRHNQYEGAIEGQLVETGAGVLYVRDFDKWKEILKRKKKTDSVKTTNSNDTINTK